MDAFEKLFSDRTRVNGTLQVKRLSGETHSAKLTVGPSGLDDASFVEAAAAGASFTKSRKDVNARGETVTKKLTIKADDVTSREAQAAVTSLLGVDPVPPKVRDRGKAVEPSLNATAAADGATVTK